MTTKVSLPAHGFIQDPRRRWPLCEARRRYRRTGSRVTPGQPPCAPSSPGTGGPGSGCSSAPEPGRSRALPRRFCSVSSPRRMARPLRAQGRGGVPCLLTEGRGTAEVTGPGGGHWGGLPTTASRSFFASHSYFCKGHLNPASGRPPPPLPVPRGWLLLSADKCGIRLRSAG